MDIHLTATKQRLNKPAGSNFLEKKRTNIYICSILSTFRVISCNPYPSCMRIPFACFILLFGAMWAGSVWGQQADYAIPGYSVAHYTDENGLPQNSIKNIGMDDRGYIWLATEAGLVRYDGRNFRLLSKEEMGIRHPRIYFMGRSPINNQLYAFSEENDQVKWKASGQKPIFYQLPAFFSDTVLSSLHRHPLTSVTHHLPVDFQSPAQKHMLIHVTPDSFYIVMPGHVVYRTYRHIVWETDTPDDPRLLLYWQGKRIYFYTPEGSFLEVTPRGTVAALQVPGFKKMVWNNVEQQTFIITRENKVYLLGTGPKGNLAMQPFLDYFPPDFEVETMYHIKKQVLFVGGMRQGLLVCKKNQFRMLASDLPDNESVFYGIYPYDGTTILTSRKSLIDIAGKKPPVTLPKGNFVPFNRSLTQTRNGTFLIAQQDSLMAYSPQGRFLKTVSFHNQVSALYTDRKSRTWVATVDSGVYLLNDDLARQKRFVFPSIQYVNYMMDVTDNLFLLGTRNGLFWFSVGDPHIRPYPETEHYNVRSIFRSRNNRLYLCTYGDGIILLGPRGPIPLPEDKAGYLNTVHCIQEDHKGRIWISTNKGLFYTHEMDIIRYAEKKITRVYYHYINKESGLKTNEFNGGCQPCGLSFPSGDIVFPSMNGLALFNPDTIFTLQPKRELDIEKIAVDDRFLDKTGDTVSLERTFKRLEIYLTTPFYGSPENLSYEYTYDSTRHDSWVPINTPNSSIAFTSLPPGYSYISFRQKRVVGSGAFSYRTLVLYRARAFWEIPLFWGVCVALMALAVVLLVRLRTQTLKQRNRNLAMAVDEAVGQLEKKTRFQQWLTSSIIHDLRGPLRFINFYGGDIQKDGEETDAAQNKFLKSVYFSALKIYNYSDNLVQLLSLEQTNDFPPEKTDFLHLVEDKREQFREQAAWNGISLSLDPESDPFLYVNKAALSIIIQNLLDNSVKNLKNGNIYLSLKNGEQYSIIEIRDEGPGLPPELLQKFNDPQYDEISRETGTGLGLWLVKSLMAQTGGHIRFQNLPQKGLSITLTWKINTA